MTAQPSAPLVPASASALPPAPSASAPRVGFVSLGCPKALTDSELILTQLSAEGYATSKTFSSRTTCKSSTNNGCNNKAVCAT